MLAFIAAIAIAAADDLPAYTPDPNAERTEIPDAYKWDLGVLFADTAAWNKELERVQAATGDLESYKGRLADPRVLKECLDTWFQLQSDANRLSLYAGLNQTTAESDGGALDLSMRGQGLIRDLGAKSGFVRTEILAIPDKKMAKAYKKEPGLETYRVFIDDMRRRRTRVLSPEGEDLLALFGDNLWASIDLNELEAAPEKAFKAMLTDMPLPMVHDEEGEEVQLNMGIYVRHRKSPDREVRKEAVDAFFGTLRSYQHVYASTLAGQYELDVHFARARGYDTALEAYLDKDDVDPAVYKNLVATVGDNLEPLHRYVSLRKRALGLDKVHLYDMYVPLVEGVEKDVPFDEARETVLKALGPMGEDYLSVMKDGMDPANGWVDVYPHDDKSPGAFCAATYGVHPYVMLNHQDTLYDMSTMAHEYGHAMHSYLSMRNQPEPQWGYVNFLAETASTANEAMLSDYLIKHASTEDERIFLLNDRLESIKGTIYRQTMFAEFEWKVHTFVEEGTPITAELLDETYRELVKKYYGPDYELGPDDGMEWAYIGHFYYKYYLYSYATGLSSGIAFATLIEDKGPAAREPYLDMLRAGSSKPPLELMKEAGVDMSTPAPIEAALQQFADTLAELEVLLEAREARENLETEEGAE